VASILQWMCDNLPVALAEVDMSSVATAQPSAEAEVETPV
jgi:hypothetical protein